MARGQKSPRPYKGSKKPGLNRVKKDVPVNKEKFLKFKVARDDSFFYQLFGLIPNYPDLWKIMKQIFIASHGQSFTERGFSVNNLKWLKGYQDNHFPEKMVFNFFWPIQKIYNMCMFPY